MWTRTYAYAYAYGRVLVDPVGTRLLFHVPGRISLAPGLRVQIRLRAAERDMSDMGPAWNASLGLSVPATLPGHRKGGTAGTRDGSRPFGHSTTNGLHEPEGRSEGRTQKGRSNPSTPDWAREAKATKNRSQSCLSQLPQIRVCALESGDLVRRRLSVSDCRTR